MKGRLPQANNIWADRLYPLCEEDCEERNRVSIAPERGAFIIPSSFDPLDAVVATGNKSGKDGRIASVAGAQCGPPLMQSSSVEKSETTGSPQQATASAHSPGTNQASSPELRIPTNRAARNAYQQQSANLSGSCGDNEGLKDHLPAARTGVGQPYPGALSPHIAAQETLARLPQATQMSTIGAKRLTAGAPSPSLQMSISPLVACRKRPRRQTIRRNNDTNENATTKSGNKRAHVRHNYHDYAAFTEDDLHRIPEQFQDETKGEAVSVASGQGGGSGNIGNTLSPFPTVLYQMLEVSEAQGYNHIVCWQPHGRSFHVHDSAAFVSQVMPIFFRQTKYASFQRQLALYGFLRLTKRTSPDLGCYYHELFLRGRPHLLSKIQRIRVKGSGVRPANDPDSEPDFFSMPPVGTTGSGDGPGLGVVPVPRPEQESDSPSSQPVAQAREATHPAEDEQSQHSAGIGTSRGPETQGTHVHEEPPASSLHYQVAGSQFVQQLSLPLPPPPPLQPLSVPLFASQQLPSSALTGSLPPEPRANDAMGLQVQHLLVPRGNAGPQDWNSVLCRRASRLAPSAEASGTRQSQRSDVAAQALRSLSAAFAEAVTAVALKDAAANDAGSNSSHHQSPGCSATDPGNDQWMASMQDRLLRLADVDGNNHLGLDASTNARGHRNQPFAAPPGIDYLRDASSAVNSENHAFLNHSQVPQQGSKDGAHQSRVVLETLPTGTGGERSAEASAFEGQQSEESSSVASSTSTQDLMAFLLDVELSDDEFQIKQR